MRLVLIAVSLSTVLFMVAAVSLTVFWPDTKANHCPAEQKRREHMRREFLAFDPLRNSTEYEEYRPS
jgi:hypothetical protein